MPDYPTYIDLITIQTPCDDVVIDIPHSPPALVRQDARDEDIDRTTIN
jgi:hypothetical protein